MCNRVDILHTKQMILEDRDYQQIEELVQKYKNGDEAAAEMLIRYFHPFLCKYLSLLKDNKFDIKNKDSRNFVCSFLAEADVRALLKKHWHSAETIAKAYNCIGYLNKVCEQYTSEDIYQELIVILLTLCKRYDIKKGKNFCGYVNNAFRYELSRKIKMITKDPIVFSASDNMNYNDLEYIDNVSPFEENPKLYVNTPVLMEYDNTLDIDWVNGITCSDSFYNLERMERLILKCTYQDGMTDIQISEMIGVHRHTIRNKRIKAIEKLKQEDN
jgi:RNA polymerase sigma factor (sigma-70 family)